MFFTGHYEHSIDSKHRLAVPAEIRNQWRAEEDGGAWYALPWIDEGVIRLYTENYFRQQAASYQRSLTPDSDEALLNRLLFGNAARVEMDSAGRIRIPEWMREKVGLGSEVTLVGSGDWLEIQDRRRWKEDVQPRLKDMSELLARMRAASAKQNTGE